MADSRSAVQFAQTPYQQPRSPAPPPPRSPAAYGGSDGGLCDDSDPEANGPLPGLDGLAKGRPAIMGGDGAIYHSTSLFVLRPFDFPRWLAIETIEQWWFEPFIAVTIAANCFTMAWESPLDPPNTWKAEFIAQCETAYLAIFTCELVLKIVAMGFLMHRHSYLRDVWCQLDFVVVTLAWCARLPLPEPPRALLTPVAP